MKILIPSPYNIGSPVEYTFPCGNCKAYFDTIVGKVADYVQSDNSVNQQFKQHIHEAWQFLRKNNTSIPDEILDFMRDAALEAMEKK